MYAWKIFEEKEGEPSTLFHGVGGSRRLTVGRWLDAEAKPVRDGRGGTRYISGFHAYRSLDSVQAWAQTAKKWDSRVVVQVRLDTVSRKPGAVRPTLLAARMRIDHRAWARRVPLTFFTAKDSA